MTKREMKKLKVMLYFARGLTTLSTCKRNTVGCVIVSKDYAHVSIGYNGQPAGLSNDGCSGVKGQCGCAHAEANALTKFISSDSDHTLITTTAPCETCARLIINTRRIKRVIFATEYRNTKGIDILKQAGIQILQWQEDDYACQIRDL